LNLIFVMIKPMKILVPIKRVIDFNVRVRVKPDFSGVVTDNIKMSMNPFDEIAVEEAVKLKEAGKAEEIILCSIGAKTSQETLRSGLALGADRAILIETDAQLTPLVIAKLLKFIVNKEQPQLVILGKQAIDDDNNQTGQMLAGLLGWAQGTFVSKVELETDFIKVTREIDGGLESLKLKLPAIITTDLRLNVPRYASLPNIMKAKSKKLDIIPIVETGVGITTQLKTIKVTPPPTRKPGVMVDSAAALISKLKDEAGVI
jgi:electron transfer flavoprotein beta subunit